MQWSKKKQTNPNQAYEKVLKYFNDVKFGGLFVFCTIVIGPLIGALNDLGKIPLDDRSHFPLLWPKFGEKNDLRTYGMTYLAQLLSITLTYISVGSFNFGFMVMLHEFLHQFGMLLDELNEAFDYRNDKQFERRFIDCIIHHQMIIK
ncbi:Hypothetical protein CINCED_3A010888 [Cinara cedri]|uniref:Uncharacterized protein n=1 Tax=Cinara cedri TaxID=506608 RepID=A0A5E4MK18_9HEMI|nr:Hypothetical protein CINCED_3A010888 [Cinara cedri]